MRRFAFCISLVFLAVGSAGAQTIQLPTFHTFSVQTTVVAPDGGGVSIAGDRRASYGDALFGGVPRNRGWGITRQAGALGVTAQIHNPQEAEKRLAGSLVRRADSGNGVPNLRTAAGTAASDAPLASIAELKARHARQATGGDRAAALSLLEKGRSAHAAGKTKVAALYFRQAAAAATGPLKDEIAAELDSLAAEGAAAARAAAKTQGAARN